MQRYLNQLLADLETATRHAPDASTYRFVSRFHDDEDEGDLLLQARYVRLCELFGISAEAFPPVDRLTKAQVSSMLTAIESLWKAWHINWECPRSLTARRRYTIMVERMGQEKIRYHYDYGAEINFCDCRAEGKCPFEDKKQCACDAAEAESRRVTEVWDDRTYRTGVGMWTDYDDFAPVPDPNPDPMQPVHDWLHSGKRHFDPWDVDEDEERWHEFMAEEDMMTWLYFYQPRNDDEEADIGPEDFDDFEWGQSGYEDYDLPF